MKLLIFAVLFFVLNSRVDCEIDRNLMKRIKLPIKSNNNDNIFFSPCSAPIAPIINDSSSFYLFYSDKNSSSLIVQKVSNQGEIIGSPINTGEIGTPFDIVSTEFGFLVMARNQNQRLWVQAFNSDGKQMWKRILIKGIPSQNQIPNNNEEINFENEVGMNAMFDPHSGRLNYVRGKVNIIWSHYNQFDINEKHTGDSMISLDAFTGQDVHIFWSWGTSHSLYQNLHSDGKNLYSASLGDAYPMNINFNKCDLNTHKCQSNNTIIEGYIVGDKLGKSSGRLGGFIDIKGQENNKYFLYSRKQAVGKDTEGQELRNDKNEVVLIKFNNNFEVLSSRTILSGDEATRVNALKIINYGEDILIGYSQIPQKDVQINYNRQKIDQNIDTSSLILIQGSTLSEIQRINNLEPYQISATDDWKSLEDGTIAYTLVDQTNNINIFLIPLSSVKSRSQFQETHTSTNSKWMSFQSKFVELILLVDLNF